MGCTGFGSAGASHDHIDHSARSPHESSTAHARAATAWQTLIQTGIGPIAIGAAKAVGEEVTIPPM